jgi:GxxExxY protein
MKMAFEKIDPEIDKIASQIVDAAYKIHKVLGPGLLENAYEMCLVHELTQRGLKAERQVAVPLIYEGVDINVGFRMDLLVENRIILEIKAVEALTPLHEAQILTYLKLANKRLGFLINFNVLVFKKGIKRIAL